MADKINYGKDFEKYFKISFENYNTFIYRLPDIPYNPNTKFNGHKQLCDFFVFKNNKFYLFELKSTQLTSLPLSNFGEHQIPGMIKETNKEGDIYSYLVVQMRHYDKTYCIEIKKVEEYIEKTGKKSLSIEFLKEHGVELEMRTKKQYKIPELFEKI